MSGSIVTAVALLFGAGFIENFVNGWHTKAVAHGHTVNTLLSGTIYVLVWYTALRVLVENLTTVWVALAYALGSGIGSLGVVLLYKVQHRRSTRKTDAICADT